ncbi:MAG TPA: hypothetical protein VGP25_03725 [Gemmatimonadaceae bacterium]|jgi:hypothetical protein|nr:hypothetical protein [Gemmatimonadaceae bacterium]
MSLIAVDSVHAQKKISISVHEDAPDSVTFIVPREQYDVANAKVRSRDRSVTLLLTDTTLVLQLSQRGMDRVETGVSEAKSDAGLGARLVARMFGAGLTELLDHGIAYRLSALRSARADGHRLVLEDHAGHRVFENVEVNGTHLLEDLEPRDAERFAESVNRALKRVR